MRFCCYFVVVALMSLVATESTKQGRTGKKMSTPTTDAASVVTPPPLVHNLLEKRALATCGFVSGNSASPLTCPSGYNCATSMRSDPTFGCCNNVQCLDDWGWCREFGQGGCQGYNLEEAVCTSILGPVLQCSSDAPHCFRYARTSSRGDATTWYSYACGTASADILVLATATNGANPAPTAPTTGSENNPLTLLPGFTQTALGSASSTSRPVGGNGNGNGNGNGSGIRLSTTAIALIAVFGFAVLLGASLFFYCCCYRTLEEKKRITRQTGPIRPPYQPTEPHERGEGSVNTWTLGVRPGPPPSGPPSHAPGSEYGEPSSYQRNAPRTLEGYNMQSGGFRQMPR